MSYERRGLAEKSTKSEVRAVRPRTPSQIAREEWVTADLARDERYEPLTTEPRIDAAAPVVTAGALVWALVRVGFVRDDGGGSGCVVLSRDGRVVALAMVDDDTVLEPALVRRVLAAAAVKRAELLGVLAL
jgi:hypothetical protein